MIPWSNSGSTRTCSLFCHLKWMLLAYWPVCRFHFVLAISSKLNSITTCRLPLFQCIAFCKCCCTLVQSYIAHRLIILTIAQPMVRELRFCGRWKGSDFKASLQFFKGIANLPWMANELSNPQLNTCSCGPHINLVMCIWPGSAAWLHTPGVACDEAAALWYVLLHLKLLRFEENMKG